MELKGLEQEVSTMHHIRSTKVMDRVSDSYRSIKQLLRKMKCSVTNRGQVMAVAYTDPTHAKR